MGSFKHEPYLITNLVNYPYTALNQSAVMIRGFFGFPGCLRYALKTGHEVIWYGTLYKTTVFMRFKICVEWL